MERLAAESLALLRKMIATPSLSFQEEAVCELVCKQLGEWGVKHQRIGNNVLAYAPGPQGAKTLVLDAHLDTVPAAQSYTRDPLEAGSDPSVVYGLGSNDDGGSVVAMIATLRYFLEHGSPVNLVLELVCEEERSGAGGAQLLFGPDGPYASGMFPKPDAVIVGEPTGMRVATSERGLLVLDALAKGVSGHAARGEGVNAIYIALEDISKLLDFRFGRHSATMGDVRLSVTQINAGTAHNVVPDSCSFVVDIRPTDAYGNDEIWQMLQAECRSTLTPRNLKNKSSATREASPLLEAARRLGMESFSSPTTSNWIRIDCDAVKMGPGDSSRSHRADEYILASEVEDAIAKYIRFIYEYGNIVE